MELPLKTAGAKKVQHLIIPIFTLRWAIQRVSGHAILRGQHVGIQRAWTPDVSNQKPQGKTD